MTYEYCTFAEPFRRLPLTGDVLPDRPAPRSPSAASRSNFSSVVYLCTSPPALCPKDLESSPPIEMPRIVCFISEFNMKSIGNRKAVTAIEATEGEKTTTQDVKDPPTVPPPPRPLSLSEVRWTDTPPAASYHSRFIKKVRFS